jgi:hypothetical protein
MKKLIMVLLLCISGMSHTMEDSYKKPSKPLIKKPLITLPSANVLERRLQRAGFSDFVARTDIFQQIGEQRKNPWKIYRMVDIALYYAYEYDLNDHQEAMRMQRKKLCITNLILEGFPDAIKWLAETGIVLNTEEKNS